jgi:hypothetical protein
MYKSIAIHVTGRGGLCGCEMLRIRHCLGNGLTVGGQFVSLTRRPSLFSAETIFLCFWYALLLETE